MPGPLDITNVRQWKASAGVFTDAGSTPATDGQTVQQWNEQGGTGDNFTQATSGNRPLLATNIVNGKATLRFGNSSAKFFACPDALFSGMTEGEAYVVLKLANDPPGDAQFSGLWKFGTASDDTHCPYTDGHVY